MKKEHITAPLIFAATLGILFVAKPRKSKMGLTALKPKAAAENENEYKNAVDSITAYRAAINAGESKERLDELNRELLKEFNIRIINKGGLLTATTRAGKEIATEKV